MKWISEIPKMSRKYLLYFLRLGVSGEKSNFAWKNSQKHLETLLTKKEKTSEEEGETAIKE